MLLLQKGLFINIYQKLLIEGVMKIYAGKVCDTAFMLCGGLKSVLVISGRKGKTNKCKK